MSGLKKHRISKRLPVEYPRGRYGGHAHVVADEEDDVSRDAGRG